jgi:hypothetical protein
MSAFAKNLTEIEDNAQSYYIANNVLPKLSDSVVMNKDDLLLMAEGSDILLNELSENNDLNSEFYKVDLSKINVTKISYGNSKLGLGDIFVISYPKMNVYYVNGLSINDNKYYSITSKITNTIKTYPSEQDIPAVPVIEMDTIKVSQSAGWVNEMGVSIETTMNPDETLYMSVSGGINRQITTTIGNNILTFNLLSSIVNNSETMKVPSLTTQEANYIELGIKPINERYVDILKYKNGKIIDLKRIDLSNFSIDVPKIMSANISTYEDGNTINLSLGNSESGISDVRYEYLTKFTDQGTIENYYMDISDFDS